MALARLFLCFLLTILPCSALAGAVSLLPAAPVVGDGLTTSTVRVWVPGISGTDRVRLVADDGRVGTPEIGADGVVTFTLIPPAVKAPRDMKIAVKIQGTVLRVDESVTVSVVPPYAGALKVSFDPATFSAGGGSVNVKIIPDSATAQAPDARRIVAVASAGTIETPVSLGDGSFSARWLPPANLPKSRTVTITAADAAAPDKIQGWAVLPVLVKQSMTFSAPPASSNVLAAGDRQWGPTIASPAGTVAFDVDIHPAKTSARLTTIAATGAKTEQVLELPVEDYNRIGIFPLPAAIPADPNARVAVRIAVTKRSGEPLSNAPVSIHASAGSLAPAVATSRAGVYEAIYTPPDTPADVTFTAEADGQQASTTMKVLSPLPSLSLSADPAELPKGITSTNVTVRQKDARGAGIVGRIPALTAEGANKPLPPKDNKDGTYSSKLTISSKADHLLVTADPPVTGSGLPASQLVLWAARGSVPANGAEQVPVTVAALDAYGLPVAGVKVRLAVPVGDGAILPEVTTNASGLARATYKAGTMAGPVTLRADGAGLWTQALLFQAGPGVTPPASVPSGSPQAIAALLAWQAAAPALVVTKAGVVPVVKVGPPAAITLTTVPPYTTPGAAILVVARVTDVAGLPIPKAKLTITPSLGTAGAVTDNGDGTYSFPVQLPPGQDGPLTVSITTGVATGSSVLPTFATMSAMPAAPTAAASAAPSAGTPSGGKAPKAPKAPKEPKPGAPPAGLGPWARASGAFATVARTYELSSSGEADVPDKAKFETGAVFGSPGLDLRGQAWPGNRAIGFSARTRFYLDRVEVGTASYSNVGWMFHGGVRYRKELMPEVYVYGVGEVHRFNGLIFRYEDDNKTTAALLSKGLWGARIGPGVQYTGAGPLFADFQITESFAPFPVDFALGLELAYDLPNNISIRAGLDWDIRSMTFEVGDAEPEEVKVKDSERAITVGVGYVFR